MKAFPIQLNIQSPFVLAVEMLIANMTYYSYKFHDMFLPYSGI